ncbi:hypothetical protein TNCV_4068051 [Trichonephila clavipes]|nr:hypothetical protein TNCV_4068051 [Trichonephila clavipes]
MAPWPRAPVIPQLVDRKTFRDNRWMPRNPDRIKWSKPNVAEIIDVKEEHYSVKFLKNNTYSNKFLFDKEETYEIGNRNIVFKLPKPQSIDASERQCMQLTFETSFLNYSVE